MSDPISSPSPVDDAEGSGPDLLEQRLDPNGAAPGEATDLGDDDEAPEADRWEQALDAGGPPPRPRRSSDDPEAPTADVWEQSLPAGNDDFDDYR